MNAFYPCESSDVARFGPPMRERSRLRSFTWSGLLSLTALSVSGLGCAGSGSVTSDSATGKDIAALTSAFNQWETLPTTCQGVLVRKTLHVATVQSNGVSWATAQFVPPKGCYEQAPPVNGGPPMPPKRYTNQINPWSQTVGTIFGIFERNPRQTWAMNDEAGQVNGRLVYPCAVTPPGTQPPGPSNGAIPADVLAVWNMRPQPSSLCEQAFYPYAAR